jgi:hypothetical protein
MFTMQAAGEQTETGDKKPAIDHLQAIVERWGFYPSACRPWAPS